MSTIEKAMAKLQSSGTPADQKDNSKDKAQGLQQEMAETKSEGIPPVETSENSVLETQNSESSTELSSDSETESAALPDIAPEDVIDAGKSSQERIETESSDTTEQTTSVEDKFLNKHATPERSERTSNYFEIDIKRLEIQGFVTQESEDRVLREQFRAIKRKVLKNAFGNLAKTLHYPNLVIVSSCNPHEGKTFSSINLALNIALEQDKTVLLVDADIVRPSVANRLGMDQDKGLTEFLAGKVEDVSEVIFNTNIENFKFIPAGTPHELSTEFLASEKMSKLTDELSSRYADRIVIFDAPPLLGVNETPVLANLVGQALIVVEQNKTRMTDIQAAAEQLDKDIAVGFVMNKTPRKLDKHYGYGYGEYGHYKSS